eukprot:2086667-Pleurochrysis_carterae.AAC.1
MEGVEERERARASEALMSKRLAAEGASRLTARKGTGARAAHRCLPHHAREVAAALRLGVGQIEIVQRHVLYHLRAKASTHGQARGAHAGRAQARVFQGAGAGVSGRRR